MSKFVSLKDVVSMPEAVEFLDNLLKDHAGEEGMMILTCKVAVVKAILEKALGIDPIIVTLEDVE